MIENSSQLTLCRPKGDGNHASAAELRDEHGRHCPVPGSMLEHQFSVETGYIVFLVEDCPYEEALHILYLDKALHILDWIELSAWFSPGVVDHVTIAGPRELQFSFFSADERWRLRLLPRARRSPWRERKPITRHGPWFGPRWLALGPVNDAAAIRATRAGPRVEKSLP